MVSIGTPDYQFYIYEKDGKKYVYARSDAITEGGPYAVSTPDNKIIGDYIKQHYEPRPLMSLNGVEKYFEPLFDSKAIYKRAYLLLDKLREIMNKQQELNI